MNSIRKQEGFQNQKSLIIPGNIIHQAVRHPLVRQLYITDIGFFPHAQYHYREREDGAQENILIYCVHGEGFVVINGQRHRVPENSALLIPQGQPHIYGSSEEKPWDIYWFHFKGESAGIYAGSKEQFSLLEVPLSGMPQLTGLFHSVYDTLAGGYTENNMIYVSQCFGYFMAILFYLPFHQQGSKDRQILYIESTTDYMKDNLGKILTLQDMAEHSKLSKSQLAHVFKEKTGYSPIDFFIHLKIQKACSCLDFSDMSVAEVAQMLGYEDPYYFSRAFKKVMGMAPSDYRKIKKG
jgi:AraC-like DNA-binding protein/mannose-6-phosphate isomerase-like protein (cupin superfamily)